MVAIDGTQLSVLSFSHTIPPELSTTVEILLLSKEALLSSFPTNTDFVVIDRQPIRQPKEKRTDELNDLYSRVDKVMGKLQDGKFYTIVNVDDAAMGIDGSDW